MTAEKSVLCRYWLYQRNRLIWYELPLKKIFVVLLLLLLLAFFHLCAAFALYFPCGVYVQYFLRSTIIIYQPHNTISHRNDFIYGSCSLAVFVARRMWAVEMWAPSSPSFSLSLFLSFSIPAITPFFTTLTRIKWNGTLHSRSSSRSSVAGLYVTKCHHYTSDYCIITSQRAHRKRMNKECRIRKMERRWKWPKWLSCSWCLVCWCWTSLVGIG